MGNHVCPDGVSVVHHGSDWNLCRRSFPLDCETELKPDAGTQDEDEHDRDQCSTDDPRWAERDGLTFGAAIIGDAQQRRA